MQIDPKLSMWLNVFLAVCGGLAAMSPTTFPSYIPPGITADIVQTAGFLAGVLGILNMGLHGMSAGIAGPMTKSDPGTAVKSLVTLFAVCSLIAGGLTGCANLTQQQRDNLTLELALAKQIGGDVVKIWCATSGIIYVIANDTAAQGRVTNILAKNAQAATDACPLIARVSGIEVDTPQTAPAGAPNG